MGRHGGKALTMPRELHSLDCNSLASNEWLRRVCPGSALEMFCLRKVLKRLSSSTHLRYTASGFVLIRGSVGSKREVLEFAPGPAAIQSAY